MRVAYLISEYPKVSHSFIRREIAALERQGVEVLRFAIRGPSDGSPDSADVEELRRTRYVLGAGAMSTLAHVMAAVVRRPRAFMAAARSAWRLSRRAERSLLHHVAYLVEACIVGNWMHKEEVPHLHAHFGSNPAAVAMLAAQINGGSFSFTAHGTVETDAAQFIGQRSGLVLAVVQYRQHQIGFIELAAGAAAGADFSGSAGWRFLVAKALSSASVGPSVQRTFTVPWPDLRTENFTPGKARRSSVRMLRSMEIVTQLGSLNSPPT